ncbi:hypothetical protein SEA_ABBA_16 [Arthrobacter phage Abba]|uniref:Uncharacterized protein n=1 Tax=Arthrobacter phage Abba TaxID=2713256 RepID=A0A6G8R2A4_9CAUD|nr:tail assembly chaperone [Arthrobacter phage Abba]QIN94345.1 hypothetical protein SEA_ABBA_16 [Arthrobacter phage Abba]
MAELFGTPLDEDFATDAPAADEDHGRRVLSADLADAKSPFDFLKAEAEKEIARVVTYENTERPGFFMRFNAVVDGEEVKRYQRAAQGKKKRPEDADMIRGNVVMFADKNVAILHGKDVLVDEDGDEITFTSEAFVDLFASKEGTIESALKKFLGDAQIIKLGAALLREAGYDDDLQPIDPTNG